MVGRRGVIGMMGRRVGRTGVIGMALLGGRGCGRVMMMMMLMAFMVVSQIVVM